MWYFTWFCLGFGLSFFQIVVTSLVVGRVILTKSEWFSGTAAKKSLYIIALDSIGLHCLCPEQSLTLSLMPIGFVFLTL